MKLNRRHSSAFQAPRSSAAALAAGSGMLALLVIILSAAGLHAQAPARARAAADGKLVPIPIELPKPGYEGTPENLDVPNMEKPLGRDRDPFLAPAGVVNVAKGKKVTSSEKEPFLGELQMITDGDKIQADGSYVELGPGVQQVTIDLGAEHEIYAILFWHYYLPRVYLSTIVQVSSDESFTKGATTLFNNDQDNKAKQGRGKNLNYMETYEGKLVDAKGTRARYVRLYSNGNNANDLNHYIEVEVYGRPAK
jgi:hypothetical protein